MILMDKKIEVVQATSKFINMKIFFTLLFPLLAYSQNFNNGSIVYEYKMNDSFLKEARELSSKLKDDSQHITFTLDFNEDITLFYLNENLSTKKNLAVSFTKARKQILSDLKKQKFYQYTPYSVLFLENEFTVEYNFFKWKLIDESRIVEKKTVYKAEGEYKALINNKIVNQKIIAWYCPEIPINIGPRGANGLPGLIYILEDRYGTFLIKNINFNSKLVIDKIILENEIISENIFFDLLIERRKIFDKAVENKK